MSAYLGPRSTGRPFQAACGAWIGALVLLLACGGASALDTDRRIAEFYHTAWTVREGAPAEITALAQSSDGYLWLGTYTGLFRFDGTQFERYQPPGGQALPSEAVSALYAPPSGGLWIGYRYGAASRLEHDRVENYTEDEGFSTGSVFGFDQGPDGTVWAATYRGLMRLQRGRWERLGPEWKFPGKQARAVFFDQDGQLWAASENAVAVLPRGASAFDPIRGDAALVGEIAQSADGTVWVAETTGSLRAVEGTSGEHRLGAALAATASNGVVSDRDGSLWVATPGAGLLRYTRPPSASRAAGPVEFDAYTEKDGLSADFVVHALEDREGNIWLGTSAGLDRFRQTPFVPVTLPSGAHDFALAAGDHGSVWVGTRNKPLMQLQGREQRTIAFDRPVSCAYRDQDGGIWLGGSAGIWKLQEGAPTLVAALPDEARTSNVQAMTRDRSGALWVSLSVPGVFRHEHGAWSRPRGLSELLERASPLTALTDAQGKIWLGFSHNRIVVIEGDHARTFEAADGLGVGNVTALIQGASHVWVGGELGLAYFDGSRFRDISANAGDPFKGISGLVERSDGSLWANAGRGVVHVPAEEVRGAVESGRRAAYELFDFRDGLPGTPAQFRPLPSAIESGDGRVWFATTGGVVWLDPAKIPRNPLPPPVLIRSLDVRGRDFDLGADVRLPPATDTLHFRFTALSLSVPERVLFRYMLEGQDTEWQVGGTRRETTYTNVGPGDYRFRVIAANDAGVWNEQGATLALTVEPTFLQTAWFRALCLLLGLGLLGIWYVLHLRQVALRVRTRLEERHLERERIARELHDTLLQSTQGLILKFQAVVKEIPPGARAREMLEQALDRADDVLNEGRERVRGLRKKLDAGEDLAEAFAAAGAEFGQERPVSFRVIVQGDARDLDSIVREELVLIGREALSNAFRHAGATSIEVEITCDGRELRLRFRDDGRGIDAAIMAAGARTEHWGLPGMRERANKIGAQVEIWSRSGAGTEVALRIPARIAYRDHAEWPRWRWLRRLRPGAE